MLPVAVLRAHDASSRKSAWSGVSAMIELAFRNLGDTGDSKGAHRGTRQKPIFYLADWLPPDFGAVGQYLLLFAREAAASGRVVRLFGLSSNCSSSKHEIFRDGGELQIKRLRVESFNKSRQLSRLAWAVMSNIRLVMAVIRDKEARGADVLFTGSPPFMIFFAFLIKWLCGSRLVYRITDFYPEVLFASWGGRPKALRLFERATWYLRRRIDEFEVLGEDQRKLLIAGGIDPTRIVLKRDVAPVRISGTETAATRPLALVGRKILLYSGNFGVAHELETVVKGLVWHHKKGSGRFGLWLNATGSAVDDLVERLRAEGIPFAHTEPVTLAELPSLLIAADAHLVSLKPSFSGYVLPSKIYACLDSRRPVLFVGPTSSDVHLLCGREKSIHYEHVDVGNFEGFALALERLSDVDDRSVRQMPRAGTSMG
jgi:hypothetical protein